MRQCAMRVTVVSASSSDGYDWLNAPRLTRQAEVSGWYDSRQLRVTRAMRSSRQYQRGFLTRGLGHEIDRHAAPQRVLDRPAEREVGGEVEHDAAVLALGDDGRQLDALGLGAAARQAQRRPGTRRPATPPP